MKLIQKIPMRHEFCLFLSFYMNVQKYLSKNISTKELHYTHISYHMNYCIFQLNKVNLIVSCKLQSVQLLRHFDTCIQ